MPFQACTGEYIASTCGGRCCHVGDGSYHITILPFETERIAGLGVPVANGAMDLGPKDRCPFHGADGFCTINGLKPFGCNVSPFYFMPGKDGPLLFVRNRFKCLICFRGDRANAVPAYKAHPWALTYIFGEDGYRELCAKMETATGKTITMEMAEEIFTHLRENDAHKLGTMRVKK